MKISLFKNDRSTVWDEVILFLITAACLAAGIALIVTKPEFWVIGQKDTAVIGVLLTLVGVMYLPALLYRLITNDRNS